MKPWRFAFCILNLLLAGTSFGELTPKLASKKVSLKDALEIGLSRNLDYLSATKLYDISKISYDNAWRTYFLPNISLNTTSTSNFTLGAYPKTPAADNWREERAHGYPNSAITLSLASYTLFNFWRDRIAFDSSKLSYERAEQQLTESRRALKYQIINAYFQSKLNQEVLDAAQRSLSIAATVLNLVKSRVPLGKATLNEVDSATVDMSEAKLQVQAGENQYYTGLINLNALLNYPLDTVLNLTTPLDYKPLIPTFPQLLANFKQASPTIRNSRLSMQLAQNALEIAEKNRLPLPTVSFSGVSVTYGNRYSGGYTSYPATGATSPGQLEIQAAINLTIPILGPGGFLGGDTVRASRLQFEVADVQLQSSFVNGEAQLRSLYEQIKQLQEQISTVRTSFESSSTLLDRIVNQLSVRPANRLELRDALASARSSELAFLQTTFSFLTTKTAILSFAGLEPEENP